MIVGAWKRLIYTPGRPEGTVDRNSYTICVLEQFHRHLKHRSIFAVRSSRWRDPRAHLLAGEAWEAARDAGMNALGLPAAPTQLLTDHATALETAYRELAARLGETPQPASTPTANCTSPRWTPRPSPRRWSTCAAGWRR